MSEQLHMPTKYTIICHMEYLLVLIGRCKYVPKENTDFKSEQKNLVFILNSRMNSINYVV